MKKEGLGLKFETFPKALRDRFVFPPFSILDSTQDNWRKRKKKWLSLGIKSEIGRQLSDTSLKGCNFIKDYERTSADGGGSVFDPVLCELMYRWFCPPEGQVIDPFAGGSVRGVVATLLGYSYWGCDLNSAQIRANVVQAESICTGKLPIWVNGDSRFKYREAPKADFLFSCPPYGNLEVYSDDEADISNMEEGQFSIVYNSIISNFCRKLKNDRFACFVVGDYRNKEGHFNNFVSKTIEAFKQSGLELYNEIILATSIGSLPVKMTKQFDSGRKIGKRHQNVLVFVKGSFKEATKQIIGG